MTYISWFGRFCLFSLLGVGGLSRCSLSRTSVRACVCVCCVSVCVPACVCAVRNCYDTLIGATNNNNNETGSLNNLADALRSSIVICQTIDKSIRHLSQYCETHKSIKTNQSISTVGNVLILKAKSQYKLKAKADIHFSKANQILILPISLHVIILSSAHFTNVTCSLNRRSLAKSAQMRCLLQKSKTMINGKEKPIFQRD